MSLLDKIKCIDLEAARTLEAKNFVSDRKIKSLTPEELHRLFPTYKNEKLRLAIMDLISPKTQVDTCLKKLKDSIQPNSLRAALSNNDVLDDYLNILRGMKNQMDHVQSFLDIHIDFLEEIRKEKPGESSYKEAEGSDMQTEEVGTTSEPSCPHPPGEKPLPETQTAQESLPYPEISGTYGQQVPQPEQAKERQKKRREVGMTSGPSHPIPSGERPLPEMQTAQLTYQIVVGGKTFNAHQQLMKKLKKKVPLVEFDERKQNHEFTILFCPISTRIGLDVKAAMDEVRDNKPVILVLMHHYPEPRFVANQRTWEDYPNIEIFVNVFYHDSVPGLIKCENNDQAIHHIKEKLAEIYTKNNPETSKTAQWLRHEDDQAVTDAQTSGTSRFFNLLHIKK